MKLRITYSRLSAAYFVLCLISLVFFLCIDMQAQEHNTRGIAGANTFTMLVLFVLCCAFLKFAVIPDYKAFKPNTTIVLYLAYMLWIFIPTFGNGIQGSMVEQIMVFVKYCIPLFSLVIPYNYLLNHGESKWIGWLFCISALLFAWFYFKVMMLLLSETFIPPHMIISYYVLFILPLIMLTCGLKRKIFFILFTTFVLITSIKRGGILSLGIGLIMYGIVYGITSKKIRPSTILAVFATLTMLVILFFSFANTDDNNLLERFLMLQDDDGSGRTVVWSVTIQMIEDSDLIPLLMGHGYNAVAQTSSLNMSAHNDFLEILYDYGIIGFTLYVCAFMSLVFNCIIHIVRKTQFAGTLTLFMCVYFLLSMISHVAIYSWFNIVMLTVGYFFGKSKLDARNE